MPKFTKSQWIEFFTPIIIIPLAFFLGYFLSVGMTSQIKGLLFNASQDYNAIKEFSAAIQNYYTIALTFFGITLIGGIFELHKYNNTEVDQITRKIIIVIFSISIMFLSAFIVFFALYLLIYPYILIGLSNEQIIIFLLNLGIFLFLVGIVSLLIVLILYLLRIAALPKNKYVKTKGKGIHMPKTLYYIVNYASWIGTFLFFIIGIIWLWQKNLELGIAFFSLGVAVFSFNLAHKSDKKMQGIAEYSLFEKDAMLHEYKLFFDMLRANSPSPQTIEDRIDKLSRDVKAASKLIFWAKQEKNIFIDDFILLTGSFVDPSNLVHCNRTTRDKYKAIIDDAVLFDHRVNELEQLKNSIN